MPRQAEVKADLRSTRCRAHAKSQAEMPNRAICRLLSAEDGLAGAALMASMSQPSRSARGAAVSAARSSTVAVREGWGASAGTPFPARAGKRSH